METPHGLSLTLSWGASGAQNRRSFPLGLTLRVGAALALCASCYEVGRWHGALEAQIDRPARRTTIAAAMAGKTSEVVEAATAGTAAPGQAVNGLPVDQITPLNVRDPSALVMPPSLMGTAPTSEPPATPQAIPEPESAAPSPPARVFPRPSDKVKPDPRF